MAKIIYVVLFALFICNTLSAQDCDEPPCEDPMGCPPCMPGECDPPPPPIEIPVIHGYDPNIIIGPEGFDTPRWVSAEEVLPYKILFENDPDFATGPAQTVTVYQPLDEHVNPSTFRLGSFGFGNYVFTIPPNRSTYSTRLDVTAGLGIYVDVLAGVDFNERQAFWIFKSIDPDTGLAPDDAFTGFLPVNDTTINFYNDTVPKPGEGFVNYSIRSADDVVTGDSISAQAGIVFDLNAPVITNNWVNIVDAFPPTSTIESLPQSIPTNTVELTFLAEDDIGGSGLRDIDLYVSRNGAPFYLHEENIDTTKYTFAGEGGGEYCFFTLATDNVNNTEAMKTEAATCTTLEGRYEFAITALLEGAYDGSGGMTTTLNSVGLLPTTQPYNAVPWSYAGTESVTTMPPDIVDWVLLKVRTSEESASVVATAAALLKADGEIVSTAGNDVNFSIDGSYDSLYVSVYHRNHVGLMSSGKITRDANTFVVDFTQSSAAAFGGANGVADFGDGYYGLISGDANGNGQVQTVDLNLFYEDQGLGGYLPEDFNLNSQVQNTDLQNNFNPNVGRGASFEY